MKKFSVNSITYTLLLIAVVALVWQLRYFPTQDGPSHVYNLVILHDLLNGAKDWGNLFTYRLQATPNLAFHMLAYPLLHYFSPITVEKIFVSFYIILMGVSVPVFLRTFSGKVFPFAYFAFPVMFNFCLMMGFYSYVITVPFFLLSVSVSRRIFNHALPLKMFILNVLGVALFYFHLIPAVLFIMSLGIMALIEPAPIRGRIANALKLAGVMVPWFMIFSIYMWRGFSFSPHSQPLTHISNVDLLRDFFSFSTVVFDPMQQSVAAILLFSILFFFSVYLCGTAKELLHKRLKLRDVPAEEKFLLCLSCSLVFLYFLAPFNFGEGSFFNQRFPWVIYLILLPLLRLPEVIPARRFWSIGIASVAALSLAVNFKILSRQSAVVSEFLHGSEVFMAKGANIMLYRDGSSGWSRADVLLHAASYYGIENKCVDIGNYEVNYDLFPVKYKRKMLSVPPGQTVEYEPATIRWEQYPAVDYLLAWKAGKKSMAGCFHVIWEDESLTIWRRNK